jgi:peptide methionine sulfoxide reductase msrA/msrB
MRVYSCSIVLIAASLASFVGCNRAGAQAAAADKPDFGSAKMVHVRVFGSDGKLTGPVLVPRVLLTDAEWKQKLTPEQYRITRNRGTEPAFCGGLLDNKEEGVYVCVDCGLPLFASNTKFESGTGWPSFFQPIAVENVLEKEDRSAGMVRTEILCARCGAHLGHVFDDGPRPTGMRFCLNSESLKFVAADKLKTIAEEVPMYSQAVFAGGCFWCVEAVFEEINGVVDVISGYSGGAADTANYEAVCTGKTGHAESVQITYDPAKVTFEQLLKIHFATHDPTTLNRQGNDAGTQYRSAIFFADGAQKQAAEAYIKALADAKAFSRPIVTTLEPLKAFYPAELYHQDFVCKNPHQAYVEAVALPKLEKVREKFKDNLKP